MKKFHHISYAVRKFRFRTETACRSIFENFNRHGDNNNCLHAY